MIRTRTLYMYLYINMELRPGLVYIVIPVAAVVSSIT